MDITDIDRQLHDLFSGVLSPDEISEIKKWLDADVENRRYFQRYKRDFLQMRWSIRARLIQGDFKQFQKKLDRRRQLKWTRRIAAVILLLLSIGGGIGYYHFFSASEDVVSVAELSVIKPGKPQAILELSSGKHVKLGEYAEKLHEDYGVDVSVESGTISYDFSEVRSLPNKVYNCLSTPKGGEYAIQLSDGTKVWLNAATEFRYPLYFSGNCREVYLKGEAYFEVATDSTTPFIVKADELNVRVYGTCFNVNNYRSNRPEVVLVEGSVGMKICDQEVRLEPGQKGVVKAGNVLIEEVDAASYVAWKDGDFIFDNERLEDIMDKLSRWYDVEIFYQHDAVRDIRLSGDMKRYKEIQSLLYYFERISNVRFVVRGNTILIK